MERVTITVDEELLSEIDRLIATRGYPNRSEAIRDLARSGLRQAAEESGSVGDCVAALVYAYSHDERDLSKRLAQTFHDSHELSVAAMHVHLDHRTCLEVSVLRGASKEVRHLADYVIAEKGVRHGRLFALPADIKTEKHAHGGSRRDHAHVHVRNAG